MPNKAGIIRIKLMIRIMTRFLTINFGTFIFLYYIIYLLKKEVYF